MKNNKLILLLRYAAIAGNAVFILWVTYNAVNEGFKATLPEKFSYMGLVGLLVANSYLLITRFNKQATKGAQKVS